MGPLGASKSEPVYGHRILRDVKVPMHDGVKLSVNVFLPDTAGRFPVVFQRMPYGGNGRDPGEFYAQRGYAFVIQDCRGRHDSEGEFYPFRDDTPDGLDSLDWICAQPWSNGRVGMFGPSYLGAVQWALAGERHPALQAIVPNVIPCDFWKSGYWRNGAFSLALNALWTCLEITSRTSDLGLIPSYDLNKFFRHLPLRTLDTYAGRPCQFWQDFLEHSQYGDYWKRMNVIRDRFGEVAVPAFIMGGWYDYYPGECFDALHGMRTQSRGKARQHSRVIIGPWSHLISLSPKLGEVDFGAQSHLNINALALRWFDCLLKDMDTGILDEPPVTIFVMGINEWRQENEWPLARTRFTDFFLHSHGKANRDPCDGLLSLAPPRREPPDRYVYDPADPVPTLGGNHSICWGDAFHVIQPGPFDQRPVEQRQDVLTYTTPPMEADTEVTGPIMLYLYAATDAPDTDWTAEVVDVHPDGRAINLTEGNIRARFRKDIHGPPELLEPGEVYAYRIEIQPTSNVFRNGHRIRLEVASSNFPLWDRNPNTGHKQGEDAELRIARQTVFHDSEHPSRIVLPVIPGFGDAVR
jgi:putative CocE/NonD family hydrolase